MNTPNQPDGADKRTVHAWQLFGSRLTAVRGYLNYSSDEFANQLSLPAETIRAIEQGQMVQADVVVHILHLLVEQHDVNARYLFTAGEELLTMCAVKEQTRKIEQREAECSQIIEDMFNRLNANRSKS